MGAVSVTELKARLSAYLREVRRGGEIQILDRGTPVARLVPVGTTPLDDDQRQRRERLIASGVLRPGSGIDRSVRPLDISVELGRSLDDERADRV